MNNSFHSDKNTQAIIISMGTNENSWSFDREIISMSQRAQNQAGNKLSSLPISDNDETSTN